MNLGFLVVAPIILVIALGVPALIGVYVYRDAKSREMDAVLWTLVAVLAPSLIGFIVYLVVRGHHSALRCPDCSAHLEPQYSRCPGCGKALKNLCKDCGQPVEHTWRVCPNCGAALPENMEPILQGDKGGKLPVGLLIAVIVAPLLLILVMFLSFTGMVSHNVVSSGASEVVEAAPEAYAGSAYDSLPVMVE